MAIVKSKLLKQLSNNYPNFLKKDLEKFTNIILDEIKKALKRGERVELRGFGMFSTNIQKTRISRNPKTVKHSLLAIDALQIMNKNKITNLIVTKDNNYIGMLHIHDLINAGL